uniref:Uncharacterized protein n=1 Tax=Candidatus Kentrum sp. DK TaxID=2126562 RepID=A0A450TKG3_9GAMM|nr:MAG: hypothetical protein BECKDK2373B_GA0170837_12068 [Candidatus Kentron sp. DK]
MFIRKTRKYGKVLEEKTISLKRPIFVFGAHGSGKTHWLTRLYEHSALIWGSKIKAEALYLSALTPISAWVDGGPVGAWWDQADPNGNGARWSKLKAFEKVNALPRYVAETGAVVFLDDAHKLSGRKLDVAKRCLMPAKVWVVSANQENRIPPNLRVVLSGSNPQIYKLSSDVAYDMTSILMWGLIALLVAGGMWELALVVGGAKALASGRRAAKQD